MRSAEIFVLRICIDLHGSAWCTLLANISKFQDVETVDDRLVSYGVLSSYLDLARKVSFRVLFRLLDVIKLFPKNAICSPNFLEEVF